MLKLEPHCLPQKTTTNPWCVSMTNKTGAKNLDQVSPHQFEKLLSSPHKVDPTGFQYQTISEEISFF